MPNARRSIYLALVPFSFFGRERAYWASIVTLLCDYVPETLFLRSSFPLQFTNMPPPNSLYGRCLSFPEFFFFSSSSTLTEAPIARRPCQAGRCTRSRPYLFHIQIRRYLMFRNLVLFGSSMPELWAGDPLTCSRYSTSEVCALVRNNRWLCAAYVRVIARHWSLTHSVFQIQQRMKADLCRRAGFSSGAPLLYFVECLLREKISHTPQTIS